MTTFHLDRAILPGGGARDVRVEEADGTITRVTSEAPVAAGAIRLRGVTLPGLATAHSHAFHRALRGRTHAGGGTFWTWRSLMYRAASALTPDAYRQLATAVFSEMIVSGYTAVGEFHYVHGAPDPSGEMEAAVIAGAAAAGIRLTLLDTLYRFGGLRDNGDRLPLSPHQQRFSDGSVDSWVERHAALPVATATYRPGMAAHSLRAVDADDVARMRRAFPDQVLHAHVSEQPAENAQVRSHFGRTPVRVLAEAGVLDERFTGVHLTHLTPADIADLGRSGATACFCPTTERDLADGIGPARALADAGVRLALGSDQNAVVDPFEEMRGLEMNDRLATGLRGRFDPAVLLRTATSNGYASLGWTGGAIEVGAVCDLVAVDAKSPRTAGASIDQLWYAATAADVTDVVVDGRRVVSGRHHEMGDVGQFLRSAISRLLDTEASA